MRSPICRTVPYANVPQPLNNKNWATTWQKLQRYETVSMPPKLVNTETVVPTRNLWQRGLDWIRRKKAPHSTLEESWRTRGFAAMNEGDYVRAGHLFRKRAFKTNQKGDWQLVGMAYRKALQNENHKKLKELYTDYITESDRMMLPKEVVKKPPHLKVVFDQTQRRANFFTRQAESTRQEALYKHDKAAAEKSIYFYHAAALHADSDTKRLGNILWALSIAKKLVDKTGKAPDFMQTLRYYKLMEFMILNILERLDPNGAPAQRLRYIELENTRNSMHNLVKDMMLVA